MTTRRDLDLLSLVRLRCGEAIAILALGALLSCSDSNRNSLSSNIPEPTSQVATTWHFSDVTSGSGIDFAHTFGDDQFSFILEDTGSGVALIDIDGDRLLDVYFLNGTWVEGVSDPAFRDRRGATNRLYRNLGNLRFADVTEQSRTGDPGYGMGAIVGDYDGDGDEDLYVLNWGPNVLYQNRGDGTFEDVTDVAGVSGPDTIAGQRKWSVNGFFFDPDGDGDLDLYIANYLAFDPEFIDPELPEEYPYPGPESYAGQHALLFENQGDGTFRDISEASGLDAFPGKTMGAALADFDEDGSSEIFEAVDDMQNYLFRPSPEGWNELAESASVAFNKDGAPMASMHGSCGDYDADGSIDVFVPDLARGCLYRNLGNLQFEEKTDSAGLGAILDGSGAWGSHFADFDNDTHLDLLVVRGGAFDLLAAETDLMFQNLGNGSFADVSATLGSYFQAAHVSRGAAFGDLDNDGDVDIVVSRKDLPATAHVLRNETPPEHHWLGLRLVARRGHSEAIGARVELRIGNQTRVREVQRCGSYLSQNDRRVHFGLGNADSVDELTIRWPSGHVQRVDVASVDHYLEIVEEVASR